MKNNEKKKPGSPGTTKQVTLAQADQITVLLVPQEELGHPGTALQESDTIREVAMKAETSNPPCSNLESSFLFVIALSCKEKWTLRGESGQL